MQCVIVGAAMTTDRAIAVSGPLKANTLCTKTRSKFVVVIVTGRVTLNDFHLMIVFAGWVVIIVSLCTDGRPAVLFCE